MMHKARFLLPILLTLLGAPVAQAQVERYLPGHEKSAWALAFSPDGSHLSTSDTGRLNLWSVPAFTHEGAFSPGEAAMVFSRDGRRMYRASLAVHVDELGHRAAQPLVPPRQGAAVIAMELTPEGALVLAYTQGGLLAVDATTGATKFEVQSKEPFLALALSRDGQTLYAGHKGGEVLVLEAATGKELERFAPGDGAVRDLAASPDGKRLAMCTDKGAWVWQLDGHARVAPLGLDCATVGYSPDERLLLTTSTSGLLVWDAASLKLRERLGERAAQGLAVSPDGRFAAASFDEQVRVFDLALVTSPNFAAKGASWRGASSSVLELEVLPDEQTVLVRSKDDGLQVWNRKLGAPIATLPLAGPLLVDGRGQIVNLAGRVALTDPKSQKTHDRGPLPAGLEVAARPAALHPKGQLLLVGGPKLELWDLKKAKLLAQHDAACAAVAASPKAELFAAGCDDGVVRLLDGSGKEKRAVSGHTGPVLDVTLGVDGKSLASAGQDGSARVIELSTGRVVHELRGEQGQPMRAVALSPDGRVLAAGSADGKLRAWDLRAARALFEGRHFELTGHSGAVSALRFLDKGKLLASASLNQTVSFWRVADGAPVQGFGAYRPYTLLGAANLAGARQASEAEKALFLAAQDTKNGEALARRALSLKPPLDYRDGDYTALMVAAEKGQRAVAKLLIEAGADVNAARASGETSLSSAVRAGALEMVELLLAAKANPNVRAKGGATLLGLAIANDHPEVIERLARAGVDVNAPDAAGAVPLTLAARALAERSHAALIAAGADASKAEKMDRNAMVLGWPHSYHASEALRAPSLVPGRGRPLRTMYRGKQVKVVDASKVLVDITSDDCLAWPSWDAKGKAAPKHWGPLGAPKVGLTGKVVFESVHCDSEGSAKPEVVLLVQADECFYPVREPGVELVSGGRLDVEAALPERIKQEWSNVLSRYGLDAAQLATLSGKVDVSRTGRRVKIARAGQRYSHQQKDPSWDAIWPSPEVKAAAGAQAWGSFKPKDGDTAFVLFELATSNERFVFALVGGHLVPFAPDAFEKL